MSDKIRPVPFDVLLERIILEYKYHGSIFSVNKSEFFFYGDAKKAVFMGKEAESLLGISSGPNTTLVQGIVSSYLAGSRFFELKTVSAGKSEVLRPSIDTSLASFNTDSSSDLDIKASCNEYIKAWVILHVLESVFKKKVIKKPSFLFSPSVGYTYTDMKSDEMDNFISSLIDATGVAAFYDYKDMALAMVMEGILDGTEWEGEKENVIQTIKNISPNIASSFTYLPLSGMSESEIEKCSSYLLEKTDLCLKLSPNFLGYDEVRKTLNTLSYDEIVLEREYFEHGLDKESAVSLIKTLKKKAEENKRGFSIKVSNSLRVVNKSIILQGENKYLSGRALLPLALKMALHISRNFDGEINIAYAGGCDDYSFANLIKIGFSPVTLSSAVLVPGGITRLNGLAKIADNTTESGKGTIDLAELERFIEEVLKTGSIASKEFRGRNRTKINTPLSVFDCYVAPCVQSCPIHQMVPDYVALAAEGREAEALALIYMDNPLPNITGYICEHECENHCTRLSYEGPVKIRDIERKLAKQAEPEFRKEFLKKESPTETKAAVIGAGPSGLAAAYFLSSAGFDTTLFEKEEKAGGIVRSAIPSFRIGEDALDRDIALIRDKGVSFEFGTKVSVDLLRKKGFEYIFVAIGANKVKDTFIEGNTPRLGALEFLKGVKEDKKFNLGKDVVVVGGGNTALDAARTALGQDGVESVTVLYRRSQDELLCNAEEYKKAKEEGVKFLFLALSVSSSDGTLTYKVMKLGDRDSSGRRRAEETGKTKDIRCSSLITAIGESLDPEVLKSLRYDSSDSDVYVIGDAQSGPSSVVRAIESARKAVDKAIDDAYEKMAVEIEEDFEEEDASYHGECHCSHSHEDGHDCHCHHDEGHECTCGHDHEDNDECECGHNHDDSEELSEEEEAELRIAEDAFFSQIRKKNVSVLEKGEYDSDSFFKQEGARCSECNYLCNICVDICPNRANVAIDTRETGLFEDPFQIIHIDAFCNECGVCASHCPHHGDPYKTKLTLFNRIDDYRVSKNNGFALDGKKIFIRVDGDEIVSDYDQNGNLAPEIDEEVRAVITTVLQDYKYLLEHVDE